MIADCPCSCCCPVVTSMIKQFGAVHLLQCNCSWQVYFCLPSVLWCSFVKCFNSGVLAVRIPQGTIVYKLPILVAPDLQLHPIRYREENIT